MPRMPRVIGLRGLLRILRGPPRQGWALRTSEFHFHFDTRPKSEEKKEKTTQTKSAWVKEVWMPQNLKEAVGPHFRGGGFCPLNVKI
jgi:hypothetical protein